MNKNIKLSILVILVIIAIIFILNIFNKGFINEGFEHKINNKKCESTSRVRRLVPSFAGTVCGRLLLYE